MQFERFSINISTIDNRLFTLRQATHLQVEYKPYIGVGCEIRDDYGNRKESGWSGAAPYRFDKLRPSEAEELLRVLNEVKINHAFTTNQIEILDACIRECKKLVEEKQWREDSSISQHQRQSDEVKSLVQDLLKRLDKNAIAAIRGCRVGDLYFTVNHPLGWNSRVEETRNLDIEVGNYGSQPHMLNGELVHHMGGYEIETIFRLKAPADKRFNWTFDERSEPAYMHGYGEEDGDYHFTVVGISVK